MAAWLIGVVCGLALVSGFVLGLTSFGSAILFLMSWTLVGLVPGVGESGAPLRLGVALVSVMDTPCALVLLILTHRHAHLPRAAALGLPLLLATPLGSALLALGSPDVLANALAALLLAFALFRAAQIAAQRSLPPPHASASDYGALTWRQRWRQQLLDEDTGYDLALPWWKRPSGRALFAAGVFGFLSGVLSGMLGVGGPPIMLYFALFPLPIHAIRATFTLAGMLSMPLRIALYAGPLNLYTVPDGFDQSLTWVLYLGAAFFSLIGLLAGNRAAKYTDTDKLMRILLLLMFISAVSMFRLPIYVKGPMMLSVLVLLVLLASFLLIRYFWIRHGATSSQTATSRPDLELASLQQEYNQQESIDTYPNTDASCTDQSNTAVLTDDV